MPVGKDSPRQRYRQHVRTEIKQAALRQIGDGGPASLSLNAIARELGVTGPALYKYFGSRDALLTELILEGYESVASAVRAEAARTAERPARERLHALAGAYRQWAVDAPHLHQLLAGSPSPGYEAPAETIDSARAVLGPFLGVLAQGSARPAADALEAELRAWAKSTPAVADWVRENAPDADPGRVLAGSVVVWSRMHGVVSLEIQGQFGGMGHRGSTLLASEIDALADTMGLPPGPQD
ncbi:putative HTH-type transcriptional regulator [Streptomyces sp. S4.7]|uniref:TetR/AcrR family transcriptional regulator n=1 Tax=Streptomyces sp. S4.7 TaxID=2705439 RepID=UPI00139876A0|nr:TetR/AcrR family transcriptional regulator [Streptomyces sp. S4.7]QHZ00167.1 putative HTH-type transcriptional regulator [Streptomyces sp. S4.7]